MSYADEVSKLSNKIIVCNWFDKPTLEDLTGDKFTKKQFDDFREWLDDSDLPDECSELVRQFYHQYKDYRS